MSNQTKVIFDTFKGNQTIGIWNTDEKGNVKGKAPIISFGYQKGKAIADHMSEIEDWVAQQEVQKESKSSSSTTLKLEDLSAADISAIKDFLQKNKQ